MIAAVDDEGELECNVSWVWVVGPGGSKLRVEGSSFLGFVVPARRFGQVFADDEQELLFADNSKNLCNGA